MIAVAIKKYISNPNASTIVVMSGELATAGSTFNFDNTKGSDAPTIFENNSIDIIERPTIIPISKPPLKIPISNARAPSVTPINNPINNSFVNTLNHSVNFTSSVAIALISNVADCEPMFPPLPINKGMKNASASAAFNVSSKNAITPDDIRLTKTSKLNQIILF